MKTKFNYLILIVLISYGCANTKIIELNNLNQYEVVYQTNTADFYFNKKELINYCQQKKNKPKSSYVSNDYNQIIDYLERNEQKKKIIIYDTLGSISETNKTGKINRVRDLKSEYNFVVDRIRFLIPEFTKKKKLRIYYKLEEKYLKEVVLRKWNTKYSGGKELKTINDSLIFYQIEWTK